MMISNSGTNPQRRSTGVAALLYWLLIVCGLAGITMVRFDEPENLVALWFGSIVGVSIGQILALLRVRAWVPIVATCGSVWFVGALLLIVFERMFGAHAAEAAILTLLPAAICGYLSLSERGGLVAFWFPAMLWMLVILDGGGSAGVFATGGTLPFVVVLGALFIAFLRARETRRVALWQSYGRARLAIPGERTVLRTSPLRGILQHSWSAFLGTGCLLLTAWIAPHLWQIDYEQHQRASLAVTQLTPPSSIDEMMGYPCCPQGKTQSERIREYMPLIHAQDDETLESASACMTCETGLATSDDDGARGWSYTGTPGAGLSGDVEPGWYESYDYDTTSIIGGTTYAGGGGGTVAGGTTYPSTYPDVAPIPPTVDYAAPRIPTPPTPPTPPTAPTGTVVPKIIPKTAALRATPTPTPPPKKTQTSAPSSLGAESTTAASTRASPPPKPAAVTQTPETVTTTETGSPWQWTLILCLSVLGLHLSTRALRRVLTIRHLARPFWRESFDQRISNHWQRMLIGLRDAGIRPARDEQPQAFARRIGMEGMSICATILERVRHGVRVDDSDLTSMGAAATAVYRTSRKRAGLGGCFAASFRWPLS